MQLSLQEALVLIAALEELNDIAEHALGANQEQLLDRLRAFVDAAFEVEWQKATGTKWVKP